jgi:hypothetical protein
MYILKYAMKKKLKVDVKNKTQRYRKGKKMIT